MISNAYVSSTDDDIIVGETIEIVVNADQAGYRNDDASTWINGVYIEPLHLTFTDLGGGSYQYAYTVQEEDGAVARGDLAINIVLQDASPFSNTSPPFTDLNPNDVQITTSRPSASISGPSEICEGDSALLTVVLGGTAPWTIDVFDGTSTVQYLSAHRLIHSGFTLKSLPIYTVTRVVDGTGLDNTGSGIVSITVHPLPDVQITNLQGMYDVSTDPVLLEYTPLGGNFHRSWNKRCSLDLRSWSLLEFPERTSRMRLSTAIRINNWMYQFRYPGGYCGLRVRFHHP